MGFSYLESGKHCNIKVVGIVLKTVIMDRYYIHILELKWIQWVEIVIMDRYYIHILELKWIQWVEKSF